MTFEKTTWNEGAAPGISAAELNRIEDGIWNAAPVGCVQMYAGSSEPDGWLFCDGREVSRTTYAELFAVIGTTYGAGNGSTTFNLPDLRQRFPLGKASSGTGNVLGSTGGALTQTLTTSHLPSHSHGSGSLSTSSNGSHSHGRGTLSTSSSGGHSHSNGSLTASSNGSHVHSISVRSAPLTAIEHGHPKFDRVAGASGSPGDDVNPSTVIQSGGAHTHNVTGSTSSVSSHTHSVNGSTASVSSHSHSVSGSTSSAGSGNSFSKMPPYLVLNYIIKI